MKGELFKRILSSLILFSLANFFNLEKLISDLKLLPVPETKTAVFILFVPVDRTI